MTGHQPLLHTISLVLQLGHGQTTATNRPIYLAMSVTCEGHRGARASAGRSAPARGQSPGSTAWSSRRWRCCWACSCCPELAGTARDLTASGADVLAVVELTQQARGTYEKELAKAYPFHTVQGTVGLWSKLPLSGTQPVDIQMDAGPLAATKPPEVKMAYNRALRSTVTTDHGPLAVYVAHLGSARVNPRAGFWTAHRDRNAQALGTAIAAERNERVVLLGDLNGTMDDRAFADITSRLRSAQDAAGDGFGFSWPAKFPVARIDQILV
jgi:vancomycin resistance protein VanJ